MNHALSMLSVLDAPSALLALGPSKLWLIGAVAALVLFLCLFLALWISRYAKAGPDEVLVISGRINRVVGKDGQTQVRGFRLVRGGGTFVLPIVEKAVVLSLKTLTLDLTFPNVASKGGRLSIQASAQVRVNPDEPFIAAAAESLAGKTPEEISEIATQILEGNARSAAGHFTADEACRNETAFAAQWQETAKPALGSLGLEIVSFSLRDLNLARRVVS